jgi:hypothetical protein
MDLEEDMPRILPEIIDTALSAPLGWCPICPMLWQLTRPVDSGASAAFGPGMATIGVLE